MSNLKDFLEEDKREASNLKINEYGKWKIGRFEFLKYHQSQQAKLAEMICGMVEERIETHGGFQTDDGRFCHYDTEIKGWIAEIKKAFL